MITEQTNIPHFGEIVISTMICPECGYRTTDIIPLENKPPKRFSMVIDDPAKLNARIIRSGTSSVGIPEIGARLDPGLFSEGFITNVEGVLGRFQDILMQLLRDMENTLSSEPQIEKRKHTIELIELLDSIMKGELVPEKTLTIVVEDPMGNSAIIASGDGVVREEDLTPEEVSELLGSRRERDLITDL